MFFDPIQVDNLLSCKNCKERLDEPRLLPCGKSVCSLCVSLIKVTDNDEFECVVCKNKHEMPKNGLIINEALIGLLALKHVNVSRGKAYESLNTTLRNILTKRNLLKHHLDNSNDYVKEYCIELRDQVQLTTEKAIQRLNKINEEMINEIDAYEKELIELNTKNKESMTIYQQLVDYLDQFDLKTNEMLNELNLNDDKLIQINEEAMIIITKAELEIENLKNSILNKRLLNFKPNLKTKTKSTLGEFWFKIRNMDSAIIIDTDKMNKLMLLCEFPIDQKFKLIYRATQDGFEATHFHNKCDDQPNTFVIIKSTNGCVFGGYSVQSWSGQGFKLDINAFIFSFINLNNETIKMNKSSKNNKGGIVCDKNYGPVFGGMEGSNDLSISDKSNKNCNNHSFLGHYYTNPEFLYGSYKANTYLAGSFKFQVSEIEIYTKI